MARPPAWFCIMPSRVVFDPRLTDGACRLYSALLIWDLDGKTPTEKQIGEDLGMSERKVRAAMAELVGGGLVIRKRRARGVNRGSDASTFEIPDLHRPPKTNRQHTAGRSTPNRQRAASSRNRQHPAASTALKDEKSATADDESARAVERAGSQDEDIRTRVLKVYQEHGGVLIANRMTGVLTRSEIAEVYRMLEAGEVVEDGESLSKTLTLTQREAPQ